MPTKKGFSKATISKNISAEKKAGKSTKAAVATSLGIARSAAKKAGKPWKGPAKPGPAKSKASSKKSKKVAKAPAKKKKSK
jgi:hypothetical protein